MNQLKDIAVFISKWVIVGLAVACVVLIARPSLLHPGAPKIADHGLQNSFADSVNRIAPAVVNIFSRRLVSESRSPQGEASSSLASTLRQGVETGLGSGVIVDSKGYVVTNNHVIACAERINVQLADGRIEAASVIGTDPATDIAVLKINIKNIPVAPMGTSSAVRTGDVVLAIGNPYGLSQTVTQGIVSATGRGQLGVSPLESYIQTDAAINLGNSGGALINAQGELIGINTAALSQTEGVTGISFAVPVNLVRGVMQQIVTYGHVKRGWMGVETRALTSQQAAILGMESPQGLIIAQVYDHSPAAQSGLRRGDVITRINGERRNDSDALRIVAGSAPGEIIALTVLRENAMLDFNIKLVERDVKMDTENNCSAASR